MFKRIAFGVAALCLVNTPTVRAEELVETADDYDELNLNIRLLSSNVTAAATQTGANTSNTSNTSNTTTAATTGDATTAAATTGEATTAAATTGKAAPKASPSPSPSPSSSGASGLVTSAMGLSVAAVASLFLYA